MKGFMIIDKQISKYIVFSEDSILHSLQKISDNQAGFVLAVTQSGILEGVMTDGDFRRWLVAQEKIDLSQPVATAMNTTLATELITASPEQIEGHLKHEIRFVPLLDAQKHLVGVALKKSEKFQLGSHVINEQSPCFLIAEIGNNHNGNLKLAKKLVDEATKAGAHCAKFQMRHLESLYTNQGDSEDMSSDLGAQYTLDLLSKFQLKDEELFEVFDYCRDQGLFPLCTPFDLVSLEKLESYGMKAYKLASADLTNHELLSALAQTQKPLICSTGMSSEAEIQAAVAVLKKFGSPYMLLHCNSTYPAPFKDINLNYLSRLQEIGDCFVGYSGHERGYHIPVAAVAKGAKLIEKHFTLDRNMEGNDHRVSLLPDEFQQMTQQIQELELSLGSTRERVVSQGELMNREVLGKSLVINCDLAEGQVIEKNMVEVKSPGQGLAPYRMEELIGQKAKHAFKAGDFFFPSDLEQENVKAKDYEFKRPFGIPVRYHDMELRKMSNPDLVEFHLSYRDLEVKLDTVLEGPYDIDVVVHAPELFQGDHLLDLCTADQAYRKQSLQEMQRTIDITRELKSFFPKTKRPLIITNVGGSTHHKHLTPEARKPYYEQLLESLEALDMEGVEVIPQTMPPFPWHFGGQRFQNLFMDPWETQAFCKEHGIRICFDLSHTKLACNYFNWSFQEALRVLGPHTAHLHVVDAQGVDGEGLQVGEGEIDFDAAAEELNTHAPNASFIPEIWQGHKNQGEGFWVALHRLENKL